MANITCKNIDLTVPGKHLLVNTDLIISEGTKYALIGHNGTGKTTLLRRIADKSFNDIPKDADIFYVEQEVKANDSLTVFQIVLEANIERKNLIDKYNNLKKVVEGSDNATKQQFNDYQNTLEQLRNINADKDESIVRYILFGLGFDISDQDRKSSEFSGGWRMRMSLARALYLKPKILLLDEPTNHLDLNAAIWLTNYLCYEWKNTLIVVSHDKKFISDVCDTIIHLNSQKLTYYRGSYADFEKALKENERHIEKEWAKVENRVKEMQKKGIKKVDVDKFLEDNKQYKPNKAYRVKMKFEEVSHIKPPVIEIKDLSFGYNDGQLLFENINVNIDMETRVAIVGKNGVGKTTFLRCILGYNEPLTGTITIDRRARIGYYHQHSGDILPSNKTPIEYLLSIDSSTDDKITDGTLDEFIARKYLGSIGLEGKLHNSLISTLSGGQKARVVFASLFVQKPHIIFLDEPTNHLDMETIDALIEAINNYNGGIVMITHNIDLIERTNSILWEIEDGDLTETYYEDYQDKVMEEIQELLAEE